MAGWIKGMMAAVLVTATPMIAQESTNTVAAKSDWSVFAEKDPLQCWGVSAPKITVNTKDGKPTTVRRGDILLFVTFAGGGKPGAVSFSGGYPFDTKQTVKLTVDGQTFDLTIEGEWAWPANPEQDALVLAALKKGGEAKLTGQSAKGTQTEDTFSLRGFTAAMDEAAKQCG